MCKKSKINWKKNINRSNEGRTASQMFFFFFLSFYSSIETILYWFVPLLILTGFAAYFHLGQPQTIATLFISLMNFMLLVHLAFGCTKRGEKLITLKAKKLEAMLFSRVKLISNNIPPYKLIYCLKEIVNYISPVPTTPPRTSRV